MLIKIKKNIFLLSMTAVVIVLLYSINVSAEEKKWLSSGRIEIDLEDDGITDAIFDAKDIVTLYNICK